MKIIFVIILVMLLYFSCLTMINIDSTVKASSVEEFYLDTQYIFNITENLSKIINDTSIYPPGTIAEGRAYGSKGENDAAFYLADEMEKLDLYDPTTLTYPNLSYIEKIENITDEEATRFFSQVISYLKNFALERQIIVIATHHSHQNNSRNAIFSSTMFEKAGIVISLSQTKFDSEFALEKHPRLMLGDAEFPYENLDLTDFTP